MIKAHNNSPMLKTSSAAARNQIFSRAALNGVMAGAGSAGLLSLMYMLLEATKDRSRAARKKEEVASLSPYLPTTGIKSKEKESEDKGWFESIKDDIGDAVSQGGTGIYAYPAAFLAAGVPAVLAFKYIKSKFEDSRNSQLERELGVAREEFRDALRADSKLAADIDSVIDSYKIKKQAGIDNAYDPVHGDPGKTEPTESFFEVFGGVPGAAGGTMGATALFAAITAYMLLDKKLGKSNPQVQAIQAMKALQQRRKALSEVSPTVHVKQDPEGRLYPSI